LGKKLSDFVVMSDIDGTVWDRHEGLPKRNVDALKRFTVAGGRFAVATGRSVNVARPVVEALPVNFPCVIYNGGGIYDYGREAYLDKTLLPQNIQDHIVKIRQVFPDCGVILVGDNGYADIDGFVQSRQGWWLELYPSTPVRTVEFSEFAVPALKAFLVLPSEQSKQLDRYLHEHAADFQGVRFVFSDTSMYEMLPEGSSKGSAIEKLTILAGIKRENIVAIGDYYNDLEMLKFAGLSAAPADAPEDIKAAVDLIVCNCAEGALADLVEHLEELYEG